MTALILQVSIYSNRANTYWALSDPRKQIVNITPGTIAELAQVLDLPADAIFQAALADVRAQRTAICDPAG